MKIVVAAEPIENGAGLATFLTDSIALFAKARPDWEFVVMAMSYFSDAGALEQHSNVKVIFCDRLGWRGALSKVFRMLPGKATVFNALSDKLPTKYLRRQLGNLTEIWKRLGEYDAVWVPHFAVSESRWPVLYNQGTAKAPVLLTIFDLHQAVFPEEWRAYPEMVDNFWGRFKPYAQNAKAIVTHSIFQKEAIVRHFEVDPEKIKVVYMPVPDDDTIGAVYGENEAAEALAQKGIVKPYVFSPMSQGTAHKNHIRLIRAWSLVQGEMGAKCPQLVFTSKGTPEQYKRFNGVIITLGLKDLVVFTGQVNRKMMGILYHNCTAVVSPTIYESSCGLPILEALSLGKQIAGSDIPPVREQMEHLGTAINYFDPLDEKDMARVIIKMLQTSDNGGSTGDPSNFRETEGSSRQQFIDGYLEQLEKVASSSR